MNVSNPSDVAVPEEVPLTPVPSKPLAPPPVVPMVEEALGRADLTRRARALLLLRTCQYAQILRPDVVGRYWPMLTEVSGQIPEADREAYQALKVHLEPPPPATLGKFAQIITDDVERAAALFPLDPAAAVSLLASCEERLRNRWWPFGKAPAWNLLVQRWCELDRAAGLQRLQRVKPAVQQNLLTRLHTQRILELGEWDQAWSASRSGGGTLPALCELLDRECPVLRLSPLVSDKLGEHLRNRTTATSPDTAQARKLEKEREKALERYFKLARQTAEHAPGQAQELMRELFREHARPEHYSEEWPKRFSQLSHIITFWASLPEGGSSTANFLANSAPSHLKDFALACWHSASVKQEADIATAWQELEPICQDKANTEIWFLVRLAIRGLPAAAMTQARTSSRAAELLPRLRRAWLCHDPQGAKAAISPQEVEGDLIGSFLLLGSNRERVDFLRRETRQGQESLPAAMWTRPSIDALVDKGHSAADRCLLRIYSKNEDQARQFGEYIHMHGFHHYGYDELDPWLRVTLIAWDDEYPQEVESLLRAMHARMKPEDYELTLDLLRNCIFERHQNVFPARPASFDELFVKWVKGKLVDSSMQNRVGDTIYTLSLKEIVPFLYCLVGAEKLAPVSATRCDELLKRALGAYRADADLMSSAAHLYASDKGLSALQPPTAIQDSALLEAWQTGVVGAASNRLIKCLTPAQGS